MSATTYIRLSFFVLFLILQLCGSYGCAGYQTSLTRQTSEDSALAKRRAEDATARTNYEHAASNTVDGTRAYKYAWGGHQSWQESGWLAIIVSPSDSALLVGSVPKPVTLTRADIELFENSVSETEFPKFPHVRDDLCFDGGGAFFEVAKNGQRSAAISNNCGEFGARVVKAVRELRRLAEANGGISTLPREIPRAQFQSRPSIPAVSMLETDELWPQFRPMTRIVGPSPPYPRGDKSAKNELRRRSGIYQDESDIPLRSTENRH